MSAPDTWLRDYTAARVSPEKLESLERALRKPGMSYDARLVLVACTIHAGADGTFTATDAEIADWVNEILDAARTEYPR